MQRLIRLWGVALASAALGCATGRGAGGERDSAALHESCETGRKCGVGECLEWQGIRERPRHTCEIRCVEVGGPGANVTPEGEGGCPAQMRCASVLDGPLEICLERNFSPAVYR